MRFSVCLSGCRAGNFCSYSFLQLPSKMGACTITMLATMGACTITMLAAAASTGLAVPNRELLDATAAERAIADAAARGADPSRLPRLPPQPNMSRCDEATRECYRWQCIHHGHHGCAKFCGPEPLLKMHPTVASRALTVAVVMSGDLNSDHTRLALKGSGQHLLKAWREYVVDAVESAGSHNVVHTIVCMRARVNQTTGAKLAIQPDWSTLRGQRGGVTVVGDSAYAANPSESSGQYSNLERCFLAAQALETRLLAKQALKQAEQVKHDSLQGQGGDTHHQQTNNRRWLLLGSEQPSPVEPPSPVEAQAAFHHRLREFRSHPALAAVPFHGFTHYLRARLDVRFLAPIPLAAFDDQRVSVRARAALSADPCAVLHRYSVSYHSIDRPCGMQPQYVKEVGHTFQVKRSSHIMEARAQMQAAGVRLCASFDDMFGVAPRHLGAAFFLRQATLAQSVASELLPYGWNYTQSEERKAAVRASYGPEMDFAKYVGVCACARVPMAVGGRRSDHRVGGRTSGEALDNANNADTQAESRITCRIIARLLPFVLTPLPFDWYGMLGGALVWNASVKGVRC